MLHEITKKPKSRRILYFTCGRIGVSVIDGSDGYHASQKLETFVPYVRKSAYSMTQFVKDFSAGRKIGCFTTYLG